MIGLKRKTQGSCPECSSNIDLFQVQTDCAIEMCENITCAYPFDRPDAEGLIYEFPYNDTRYSKKIKTHSSSVANTVTATSKASDVDENSVKSVKESRPVILGSSSLIKQKDQLHLEGQTSFVQQGNTMTEENTMQNITQTAPPSRTPVSLPGNIAFPPLSAARTAVQLPDESTSTASYSLLDIESLLSDINTAPTQDISAAPTQDSNSAPTQDINAAAAIQDTDVASTQDPITDCSSPSSATINTPKDASAMSWMEDLDALFGVDMAQSKFDPLGANEFDSILGI